MITAIIGLVLFIAGVVTVIVGENPEHFSEIFNHVSIKLNKMFNSEFWTQQNVMIIIGALLITAGTILVIVGLVRARNSEKDTKFNTFCKKVFSRENGALLPITGGIVAVLGIICLVIGIKAKQGSLEVSGFFSALGDYTSLAFIVMGCILALAGVVMVLIGVVMKQKISTQQLVESALMVAAGTVLSFLKIDLAFGGGPTLLSMLPLVIISHRYGAGWGVFTAFVYSVLQMLFGLDNVAWASSAVMAAGVILLDYILPYTAIGLSGIFGKKRSSVAIGIVVTFLLRFLCHFISGAWIWGEYMPEEFMGMTMTNPWFYSFLYNGWYMGLEIILTLVVAMIIYPSLEKYFVGSDLKSNKKPLKNN